MGLIKFIREKLPEPLDKASRELRMKEKLVQRINSVVPQCYKNKYHYKEGISKLYQYYKSVMDTLDLDMIRQDPYLQYCKINKNRHHCT